MCFLSAQQGETIERDVISSVIWEKTIVTEDNFYRVLRTLREAFAKVHLAEKDGDTYKELVKSEPNQFIKNRQRKGYVLTLEHHFVESKSSSSAFYKHFLLPISVFLSLLIIFIFYVGNIVSYEIVDIKKLKIPGIDSQPTISLDGTLLAFTHKTDARDQGIWAKVLTERDYIILTQGHYDRSPSFSPSGNMLAYQRVNGDNCEIRIIEFNPGLIVNRDYPVFECKYSRSMSIAWVNKEVILFTASNSRSAPYLVYQLDLSSSSAKAILSPPKLQTSETGFIKVSYDHYAEKLYLLRSVNYEETEIWVYENQELTQVKSVKSRLSGVAPYKDSFIFNDIDNRFKLGTGETLTTAWPEKIWFPSSGNALNTVAFASGEFFDTDIFSYTLGSSSQKKIVVDEASNRMPVKTKTGLYYASNSAGIVQLFVRKENQSVQLSNFDSNDRIIHFDVSPNGEYLAVSYINRTDVFAIHNDVLKFLHTINDHIFPDFSADGKRMLLSKIQSGIVRSSVEYQVDILKQTGIAIPESRFAKYFDTGIVFIRTGKTGIYFTDYRNKRLLYEDIDVFTPFEIAVGHKKLFVIDGPRKQLKVLNINGAVLSTVKIDANKITTGVGSDDEVFYTQSSEGETDIYIGRVVLQSLF